MKPTIHEVISHVAEHYGITKSEAMEIMRTPTHPKTMRDDFAKSAMQGLLSDLPKSMYGLNWESNVVSGAYRIADAMLQERFK